MLICPGCNYSTKCCETDCPVCGCELIHETDYKEIMSQELALDALAEAMD